MGTKGTVQVAPHELQLNALTLFRVLRLGSQRTLDEEHLRQLGSTEGAFIGTMGVAAA